MPSGTESPYESDIARHERPGIDAVLDETHRAVGKAEIQAAGVHAGSPQPGRSKLPVSRGILGATDGNRRAQRCSGDKTSRPACHSTARYSTKPSDTAYVGSTLAEQHFARSPKRNVLLVPSVIAAILTAAVVIDQTVHLR